MTHPCLCTGPGFCSRHRMQKGPNNFRLCQTREEYRELWDRSAGYGLTTVGPEGFLNNVRMMGSRVIELHPKPKPCLPCEKKRSHATEENAA